MRTPDPCGDSLPPDSSVDDTVTFDATELDAGDYYAKIFIFSNDPDEPVGTVLAYLTIVPRTQRGDLNCDGSVNVADVVFLNDYLFHSGPPPDPLELGDVNCDDGVDVADVVYLINYLFLGGPPPCEGKVTASSIKGLELYQGKTPAQVRFSSLSLSKDGIFNVPVIGKFDVDVAAVQLEIKYGPERISLLDPALTPRIDQLTIYSSTKEGVQKIGIVDLSGKHYIPAGSGPLVNVRIKGSDLSSRFASLTTSLEITKAILVDRDAQKIPVQIVSKMKRTEEELKAGKSAVPQEFSLWQNYPNPFNPETEISYALPTACHVKLSIYNLLGQRVRTLVNEHQAAGHKTVHWDGTDEKGNKVASGVYFYKIHGGEFTDAKKMILMKWQEAHSLSCAREALRS